MEKKGREENMKGRGEGWRKYKKMNKRYKDIRSFVSQNRKLLYCHSDTYICIWGWEWYIEIYM